MSKVLYSDLDGVYFLLDYNRSHSELLFRKRINGINTDILFKSVKAIYMPLSLGGIEISLVEDENVLSQISGSFLFNLEYGYRVYAIKNKESQTFYLNGGVFGVFENKLDILESSIGDFLWSSSNTLLFWSD